MRIFAHAYGNDLSASTRIRFSRVLRAMDDVEVVESKGHPEFADLIYIQKRADTFTLSLAKYANDNKIPLVYDIDDAPGQCAATELENRMIEMATLVTVDTDKKMYAFPNAGNKIRVVPDCIDYWDEKPVYRVRDTIQVVGSFGRKHSIEAAVPIFKMFRESITDLIMFYISDEVVDPLKGIAAYIPWDIDSMKTDMVKVDVMIAAQTEDIKGSLRSNNRLIASMAAGIPTVVNNSESYSKTLHNASLDDLVITQSNFGRVIHIIEKKNVREFISVNASHYAWQNHSPKVVATRLHDVFMEALNGA